MSAIDTPLLNAYTIATVGHVTFQVFANLTSWKYPSLWIVIYILCGIRVAFSSDYSVADHVKWYLVAWAGGISALCLSMPRLRSHVVRGRSYIGQALALVLILNIAFSPFKGLGTAYERMNAVCSVLLCIWMMTHVATLACKKKSCLDLTTSGMPISLFTPMSWVCGYAVWNALFCWPRAGLMFTIHILVDLPIFLICLVKLQIADGVEDAGYYFGFARAVSLSTYACERGVLQRPYIESIEEFAFPEDICGVLLGCACLNAVYLLINLVFAFQGLWNARTQNSTQGSDPSFSAGKDSDISPPADEECVKSTAV